MAKPFVNVIGAGLAGCEAAWQAAERGVRVRLYEMKPQKKSPAHRSDDFAELVCSNSLRSDSIENAVGLLKEEMRILDSIVIRCADASRIPAGSALAVDRAGFSKAVTREILRHPNITVHRKELCDLPAEGVTIIATGPLTSDALALRISEITGKKGLYFYDAAAPVVTYESIDLNVAFRASRYGKGSADYINCPMNTDQYKLFYESLVKAERVVPKAFEKDMLFSACMPLESLAGKGFETLRYGPLKPVGLSDPHTGKNPYAVVQLRQDNIEGSLYNMVGFQTSLRFPEQRKVFRLIPGLEKVEFVRYGMMHRNTYIHSPGFLDNTYRVIDRADLYFAGQMTGVEGYPESAASGLVAGINAANQCTDKGRTEFSPETAIGSLAAYVSGGALGGFQPMNVNFGLIRLAPGYSGRKKDINSFKVGNALDKIREYL